MNPKEIDEHIDMFFAITVICASIGIGMEKSKDILKAYAQQGLATSIAMIKFMGMEPIPFYEENKERIRSLASQAIDFITPYLVSDDIIAMMKKMEEDVEKMKLEEAGEEHPLIKKANEILGNNL
jgi:hypothetical protein